MVLPDLATRALSGIANGDEQLLPLPGDTEQDGLVLLAGFRPFLLDFGRLRHVPVVRGNDDVARLEAVIGRGAAGGDFLHENPGGPGPESKLGKRLLGNGGERQS